MSKTYYGHYIYSDLVKGEQFVSFQDYQILCKKISTLEFEKRQILENYDIFKYLLNSNVERLIIDNKHKKKVIDHLSRKIQIKNKIIKKTLKK